MKTYIRSNPLVIDLAQIDLSNGQVVRGWILTVKQSVWVDIDGEAPLRAMILDLTNYYEPSVAIIYPSLFQKEKKVEDISLEKIYMTKQEVLNARAAK